MKRKLMVAASLAAVIAFATITFAQAEPADDAPRMRKRMRIHADDSQRGQMRERVELMKMWKLTEALELDQESAAKVFPLMSEYDRKLEDIRAKRREIIGQLKAETEKAEPDTAAVRRLIDDFKKNELDMADMKVQRFEALSKVLTDEQMAKLILSVPKFERNARKLVGEVRDWREHRRGMMRDCADCPKGPCYRSDN